MTVLSRRAILGATALAVPAVLIGCALTPAQLTIASTAVTIAQVVANALGVLVPLGGTVASGLLTYAQDAINVAQSLNASMAVTAAQPLVTKINADVNAVLNALPTPPAGSQEAAIIADIRTTMPTLLAAVQPLTAGATLVPNAAVTSAVARLQALPKAKVS